MSDLLYGYHCIFYAMLRYAMLYDQNELLVYMTQL